MTRTPSPVVRALLSASLLLVAAAGARAQSVSAPAGGRAKPATAPAGRMDRLTPGSPLDGPKLLPDSTTFEAWRLPNGIRVVSLRVPRSAGVAVTVAYPTGTDRDPPGRPGTALLLAELQLTAPAGSVPARSRTDLEALRPLGWSLKVGRRATQMSEVVSRAQLPGTLRQIATRMRGVTVDEAAIRAAAATVRRDRGEQMFGTVDQSLYFQVRELAYGAPSKDLPAIAAAGALDGLAVPEVVKALAEAFDPARAVVSIAGDFASSELHALVASEMGAIPAGAGGAPAAAPAPSFRATAVASARPGISEPAGVVAVSAPALTDSLHPRFLLAMLLAGEHVKREWRLSREVATRFRYNLLDEPDLVRFYPPVAADSLRPSALANELRSSLARLVSMIVLPSEWNEFRYSVLWILGGPMPPRVLALVRTDGAALNNLGNNLAARELSGGERFWSEYRRRFLAGREPGLTQWAGYVVRPEHQAVLLFTPAGR